LTLNSGEWHAGGLREATGVFAGRFIKRKYILYA